MSYLDAGVYSRLKQVFSLQDSTLSVGPNFIVINANPCPAALKVAQAVQIAGFCPVISQNSVAGHFAFTVVPYAMPDFFRGNSKACNYFTTEEIQELFKDKLHVYRKIEDVEISDPWKNINRERSRVSAGITKVFSEVIEWHFKDHLPAIEIGSGKGYIFSEHLSKRIVRAQPDLVECHILSETTSVHMMSIKDIFDSLISSNKKVSLFFAVNVFDTLSADLRLQSLLQMSLLQNPGDKILFLLDVNPYANTVIDLLKNRHPNHEILPYICPTMKPSKIRFVLVPSENVDGQLSVNELCDMTKQERTRNNHKEISKRQLSINELQKELDLEIVVLEDLYIEFMQSDLQKAGYSFKSYYHAAFAPNEAPSNVSQNLMYRAVNEVGGIRQWNVKDEVLKEFLIKNGIILPHFDPDFLASLKTEGKVLQGAEVLVIEAEKQ